MRLCVLLYDKWDIEYDLLYHALQIRPYLLSKTEKHNLNPKTRLRVSSFAANVLGLDLLERGTVHFVILIHLSAVIRHPWLVIIVKSHPHLIVVGYLERLAICHQSSVLGLRCVKWTILSSFLVHVSSAGHPSSLRCFTISNWKKGAKYFTWNGD